MRIRTAVFLALILCLFGCAHFGIPIVEFGISVAVSGVAADGNRWQAQPNELVTEPVRAGAGPTYPAVVYDGKLFAWQFSAGENRIGAAVRSKLDSLVCFRFDQARVSTNFQEAPQPLRVNWLMFDGRPVYSEAPSDGVSYAPSQHCFGQRFVRFAFGPDVSEVFPNRTLFNVKLTDNRHSLIDHGRGNWLRIHVPVEYDGKREQVEITLTATQSRIAVSNFLR